MKPHKHAELIKAWADGAEIEVLRLDGIWCYVESPKWYEDNQYRVKSQKWGPKGGGFFVSLSGSVNKDDSTAECREFGMEFETGEAADKAAVAYRRYHLLYKLAEELNEGWEPYWANDASCLNWTIYYDHYSECYRMNSLDNFEYLGCVFFKDEKTARKALDIIEKGGLE